MGALQNICPLAINVQLKLCFYPLQDLGRVLRLHNIVPTCHFGTQRTNEQHNQSQSPPFFLRWPDILVASI
jgi:hypothetical protein